MIVVILWFSFVLLRRFNLVLIGGLHSANTNRFEQINAGKAPRSKPV
ncbi:hypothetical protein HanXRQr2_Chr02g0056591 [Helianthus annuus]|uniref:Uncharacterized protein n=1 Tax=Helianthus annuus TaxID=4232 RepID=A0A9K3JME4_HELAN|nr:hypothetical protein HanXRQr2_Chr02g0056591 [Helianthus annuus]